MKEETTTYKTGLSATSDVRLFSLSVWDYSNILDVALCNMEHLLTHWPWHKYRNKTSTCVICPCRCSDNNGHKCEWSFSSSGCVIGIKTSWRTRRTNKAQDKRKLFEISTKRNVLSVFEHTRRWSVRHSHDTVRARLELFLKRLSSKGGCGGGSKRAEPMWCPQMVNHRLVTEKNSKHCHQRKN